VSDQARIEATAAALREAARDQGMPVTPDGRVREADAELLACYSPGAFRRFRALGTGPAFYRLSINGARISYKLSDLARWVEDRREQPEL
jgi:hypothetical protein